MNTFKPIYAISKILESDNYYFLDFFIWKRNFIQGIDNKINKISCNTNELKKLLQLVKTLLNSKTDRIEQKMSHLIELASFLDPIEYKLLSLEKKNRISLYIQSTYNDNEETPDNTDLDPIIIFNNTQESDDSETDLISSFGDYQESEVRSKIVHINPIQDEIKDYVKLVDQGSSKRELFWNIYYIRFPSLFKEYCRLKSVCISNGAIERIFSYAKINTHWKRNRNKPELVKDILLFHEWRRFYK